MIKVVCKLSIIDAPWTPISLGIPSLESPSPYCVVHTEQARGLGWLNECQHCKPKPTTVPSTT